MKSKKSSRLSPAPRSAPPPTHEQIEALAHEIWIDCGRPEGRDLDHWLEAERQLRGVVEPLADPGRVDVDTSQEARIDRELDRMVGQPGPRSPTAL